MTKDLNEMTGDHMTFDPLRADLAGTDSESTGGILPHAAPSERSPAMSVTRNIGTSAAQSFGLAAGYILDADGRVQRTIRLSGRRPGHPNNPLYARELDGPARGEHWEVPLDDPRAVYASQVLLPTAEAFLALAARLSSFVFRHDCAPMMALGGLRFDFELDQLAATDGKHLTHLLCSVVEEVKDTALPRRSLARISIEEKAIEQRSFGRPLQAETFDADGRLHEVVQDQADWRTLRNDLADQLAAELSKLLDELDQRVAT